MLTWTFSSRSPNARIYFNDLLTATRGCELSDYYRSTTTESRTTGSMGRSSALVATEPMARTTAIPSVTCPKTECRSSRCGVARLQENISS